MKKALVIGGANGIGLAMALLLAKEYEQVTIIDKVSSNMEMPNNVVIEIANLLNSNLSFLANHHDIDTLIITAGFGRVTRFENITEVEINNCFQVNSVAVTKILRHYYPRMQQTENFYCAVMGSIAGLVSSPLFSLYAATKAAICRLTESLNIELEKSGTDNRILNVSPGSIKGTRFNGGDNDLTQTSLLAKEIIKRMYCHSTLYIPQYEEVFKGVIDRYHTDPHQYGMDSYEYKMNCGRFNDKPQLIIGYLSGTFDLFHIGHLNLLRRAKQHCDYLVVGVHKDASHKGKSTFIPYEERVEIIRSIGYVDKVIPSEPEDCDIYIKGIVKYDRLFVGSDYKGTERFERYEAFFADKGVEIVYFPYTQGTSSTQLRDALAMIAHKEE